MHKVLVSASSSDSSTSLPATGGPKAPPSASAGRPHQRKEGDEAKFLISCGTESAVYIFSAQQSCNEKVERIGGGPSGKGRMLKRLTEGPPLPRPSDILPERVVRVLMLPAAL